MLQGRGIHNALVIVTRYFGGTLLGTGGLVRAYSQATQAGLAASRIMTRQSGRKLSIGTDYNGIGKMQYIVGKRNIPVLDTRYAEAVEMDVLVPEGECTSLQKEITEATAGKAQLEVSDPLFFAILDGKPMIFEYMREQTKDDDAPLASRMRPRTLDEVVGQEHIVGKNRLLYRAIQADKLSSVIFYGPPGTGKTTLAKVIANTTSAVFRQVNATSAGKKDMEEVVQEAKNQAGMYGKKTILFVDEIHRFNKGQQDYLLPYVEDGTVILIGATTENPYFEVNSALISRSVIFELKPLTKEDIRQLLFRAVEDNERGMGSYRVVLEDDAADFLADVANGDARSALNALELGVLSTERSEDDKIHIDMEVAGECIQKRVLRYDKSGDNHYDTISAFIKSMRGSDPDAAVYYLARMLYAGEDVAFIARRIMICAAEDVSNADPQALVVATSAAQAVERLGMPEARIVLAQAATYVACAPKSNSAIMAIDAAMDLVAHSKTCPIPAHLQDAHYKSAAKLGHGIGYLYSHDYPYHYVKQQYLPDELEGTTFFNLSDNGYEKKIKEHFKEIGKL